MALPDYPAFLSYAGAALGVYADADVAICKGLIRDGGRFHSALMALAAMLAHRSIHLMVRWSRGEDASGVEAAAGTLVYEADFWLPIVAVCILALALSGYVQAVRRRERGRVPVPPRVPRKRGGFGRKA